MLGAADLPRGGRFGLAKQKPAVIVGVGQEERRHHRLLHFGLHDRRHGGRRGVELGRNEPDKPLQPLRLRSAGDDSRVEMQRAETQVPDDRGKLGDQRGRPRRHAEVFEPWVVMKLDVAGRHDGAAAPRDRHSLSADLVGAGAPERGGASNEGVEVRETGRETRIVISVEDTDAAKSEGTQPAVEGGFPAERLQPDPADDAAKPSGKLIRIARVDDLESLQSNRHRLVRFRPVAVLAEQASANARARDVCLAMKRLAVNEQRTPLICGRCHPNHPSFDCNQSDCGECR